MEWQYPELRDVEVIALAAVGDRHFDVVIATWWETVFNVGLVHADRAVWFMQSLEDRFYRFDDPMQQLAQGVLAVDIPIVTEAEWIRNQILAVDPERPVGLVPNGIDKSIFYFDDDVAESGRPLRILIEGTQYSENKGIRQSFEVIDAMSNEAEVTWVTPSGADQDVRPDFSILGPLTFDEIADEYRKCDVLLKLSRVEGMFGPPLEAFHCGATAVVTPVTGAEQYIKHGINSLVSRWDDVRGTARLLDRLSADRGLLKQLRNGARATAHSWPGWSESTAKFNEELARIVRDPRSATHQKIVSQAGIIRLTRVQTRINHMNAIGTLKVALNSIDRVRELEEEVVNLRQEMAQIEFIHAERMWWNAFNQRASVRILFAVRHRWRKLRRRLRQ